MPIFVNKIGVYAAKGQLFLSVWMILLLFLYLVMMNILHGAVVSPLNSIIIYAKHMQKTASFYQQFFGFERSIDADDGLIELTHPQGGSRLLIHQAARSIKGGHASLKLVFDVQDVESFKQASAEHGLLFGATHQAKGYSFANVKDPDNNSISISSRHCRSNQQEA